MNILNVMQCTNLGGMEQASLRLMAALQKRGFSFTVVSVTPLGELKYALAAAGIPAIGVPFEGWLGWKSHLELRRALHSYEPDAIFMTGPTISGIFGLGGLCRRRRIMASHFHHRQVKPEWQWRKLYQLAVNRFQVITFPSDFIRREAESILPEVRKVSRTLRNPLPLPEIPTPDDRKAAKAALELPADAPIVSNAGWLIPRKRFDVFLQTAKRIREMRPETLFVVAGDGPERDNLQKLAAELGINEAVRWLGWKKDLSAFYQATDVLLFNTSADALPTTPLEAMSYAIPVVASAENSGLSEILEANRHGFLSDRHDIDWLAEMVLQLLDDSELSRRTGIEARQQVDRICSPERCAEKVEHLLAAFC